MNENPDESAYEAPTVTEESLDSGGNYVTTGSEEAGLGTLGNSPIDPK